MPRRRSRGRRSGSNTQWRITPSRIIEAALLGALVLVPLLYDGKQVLAFHEQPKQLALHVAGVIIVIAWAYELALSGDRWRSLSYLRSWFGRTPARWAIAAAGAFALAAVLSTVFSRTPRVSLWGQDFADLGYELYSILVLLVLFFAVAMRIRGRVQVQRIVYVFTVVGAISAAYGASQHFGWDPFGPGANVTRVWSTFLNQIFFGSFLVMSLFMTVSAALLASSNGRRWAALFSLLIGLQIAALWFAGGRGALFGAFIGGIVLIVVSVIRLDTDTLRRGARDLGGGLAVGVLLIAIPIGETRGTAPLVSAFIDTAQLSGVIASSDPEKDSQPTSNSSDARFSGRAGIWRGAVELIQSRDVYPPESGVSTILRQAFGFGPETYVYSFPLTAKSDGLRGADHAHNYPLQVLLEMGVIGLITLLALVGLILLTLVRLLWPGAGPRPDPWVGVVTIGVLAALVGRAIEQGSGVAQIGDLTGYWILMGLAVALSESAASVTERVGASGSRERTRRAGNQSGRKLATLAGAAIVIAVAGGVFLFMDIQQLRGSLAAVEANHLVAQNQGTKALEKYRDAIALAPDVSEYPLRLHALLTEVASRETDPAIRRSLLEIGYEVLADAADRDPYDFLLRERLALATLTLFEDGDTGRQDEVIDRYLDFAESRPNYSEAQALLGNSALIVGSYDLGLAAADRAIELETDPGALDRAWWVRGVALDELGNPLGAIDSFQQSITANDESQWAGLSHGRLVDLFESQGDIEQAAAHRASQAALQ